MQIGPVNHVKFTEIVKLMWDSAGNFWRLSDFFPQQLHAKLVQYPFKRVSLLFSYCDFLVEIAQNRNCSNQAKVLALHSTKDPAKCVYGYFRDRNNKMLSIEKIMTTQTSRKFWDSTERWKSLYNIRPNCRCNTWRETVCWEYLEYCHAVKCSAV